MPKKSKRKISDKQLASMVTESANQIWLAGLAAFEKAQKEGTKIFDTLVREGEKVERKTRKAAEERLDDVKSKATGTWDKLEQVFEDRVEGALASLGVPSRGDVEDLSARVAKLSKAVSTLEPGKQTKRKPAAKRAAAGKSPRAAKKPGATSTKKTTTRKAAPAGKKATTRKAAPAKAASSRSTAAKASAAKASPAKASPANEKDDLTVISGVGPVLARKLAAEGITNYRQISAWTSKEIAAIEPKLMRIAGRITRDDWIAQAKKAHREKYGKNP